MQLIKFEFIKKQLTTETKTAVSELPKLVRDYIPDQIVKNNLSVMYSFADEKDSKLYLERKLVEEVTEYLESNSPEELADILEVVFALAKTKDISEKQLMKIRKSKRKKNGAFKNGIILKAKGEADRQIQIADGYASERVNRAKGDVARFNAVYEEYRKAPSITRERLYLETMEEIFASQGKDKKPTLVDGELKNVVPFKNLSN